VLRLNKRALVQQLARAPMERTRDLRNSPAVLSLPMPDGSFQRFQIEESPVMSAELAARYPEIKNYRGQGIDDSTATVRFDWTPLGFHALVISNGQAVSILPPNPKDKSVYASFFDTSAAAECGVTTKREINPGGVHGPSRAPSTNNSLLTHVEKISHAPHPTPGATVRPINLPPKQQINSNKKKRPSRSPQK
jgi:hypothetical protein